MTVLLLTAIAMVDLSTPAAVALDCPAVAAAAGMRPQVIELYTSEGCSSCPPADDWLRGLPADPARVLLAFHVDYWDDLGWADPFSDARFSARQRWRAGVQTQRAVYTPDIVIDGQHRQRVNADADALPARSAPAFQLTATARVSKRVDVRWTVPAGVDAATLRAFVAVTQNSASSRPSRGENRGRMLRHAHVVRAYSDPVPAQVGRAQLQWPPGLARSDSRLQLILEDSTSATPVQAVLFDLQHCGPASPVRHQAAVP